jgi:hypothetical protein
MLPCVRDKINPKPRGKKVIAKDGIEYARVSEILKPVSDFSHIDPEVLANKCRIGTQVHAAIAAEIAGEFPILSEDAWGYFKSFLRWRDELNPFFLQSEKRYFSEKHTITGQIDTLVRFGRKNLPLLVDFKTSATEGESWPLQAHLYDLILTENGTEIEPRYLFLKLNKMGGLPQTFHYKFDFNLKAKCLNLIEEFWKMRKSDSHLISPCV